MVDGVAVFESVGDESELIAAETGEGVGGGEVFAEIVGDAAQDLISSLMAEGVVDALEAVEIEQEESEAAFAAAAAVEGVVEVILEGAAVGQAGEIVVQGEPLVIGDLLLQHDENHAQGDESLLHVPDVGGDIGVVAIGDDEGVDEEAESPDVEAGQDGQTSGAFAGEAMLELERGDGVYGAEAPIDGFAELVVADEVADDQPSREMQSGNAPGAAEIKRAGAGDEKTGGDGRIVCRGLVDVQTVKSGDGKQGKGIEREVEEADLAGERMISGVPGEDRARDEIAVDDDDVQRLGRAFRVDRRRCGRRIRPG